MRVIAALMWAAGLAAAQPPPQVFDGAVRALNSGNYAAAEEGFQQVLASAPNHIGALQNLGLIYSRTGRLDQAVQTFRRALELRPGDRALLKALGAAYLKQGAYTTALPVFQKLVEADPVSARDAELLYLVAAGYWKLNPTLEGQREVGRFLNGVPPAPASFVLCKIYYESGRFDEAADQCRKTLAADAHFAGAHRELGKALVSQHSPGAEKELTAAVAQDGQDAVAIYYLGVALLQDGKVEEAAVQLDRATRLDPAFWGSYYYLGKARLQLQQAEQAVPLLRKAAELNSEAAVVFYELGRALTATGQTAEAERAMQRVKELRALELERDAQALRKK